MTRRELLYAGAAAALSPALLARVARAQGKGTVTVGLPSDILNFDPSAKSFVTYPVIRLVYNKLVDYTAGYQPQAELASSWKIADDFHSATFKLRPGVKFHNGRPMTSKDVVAVFQRAMDPATGQNLVTLTSAQGLRTVRAPDDATVVFEYDYQTPNILDTIQEIDIIAPEAFGNLRQTTIGTGPFKVTEWVPNDHVTLDRAPTYWKSGLPYLDRVVLKPFNNPDAMVSALQTGTIDVATSVPYPQVARLRSQSNLVLRGDGTGAFLNLLELNPQRDPFTKKPVRQAMQYAVDRDTILKTVYAGIGETRIAPYPPNSVAYNPSLGKQYHFDLAKAKALIAQGGYPNGFKFSAPVTNAVPDFAQAMQIVKADLAKIGVDMEIQLVDNARWTPMLFGGQFDATITFVALNKDPLTLFRNSPYRTSASPVFPKGDFPPGYADTINAARHTVVKEARQNLFSKLQQVLLDESWTVPICSREVVSGWSKSIQGFTWNIDYEIELEQTRRG
ncbi:MAG TPA: ABC transporter substrate-binding protein [bacterium]|nr:ABC transporter substrate-binding protein [bacterium]